MKAHNYYYVAPPYASSQLDLLLRGRGRRTDSEILQT